MMLRQIQHFQTIVQENSFTEAAELCHISQSGISQSIKALEDEIGVKLITRKNRGFELTEAGEHFYYRRGTHNQYTVAGFVGSDKYTGAYQEATNKVLTKAVHA